MSSTVIILLVLAFVIGNIFSLKPSAKQKKLGAFRERARLNGLQPKLVACPQWLINSRGEKGKGMVAQYGLVLSEAKLPVVNALVIDNVIQVVEGKSNLTGLDVGVTDALGVSMQANFVCVYIKENVLEQSHHTFDEKIENLKTHLEKWAYNVQNNIEVVKK